MKAFDQAAFTLRLEKLRKRMKREKVEGFVVTGPINVTYLSRFKGSYGYLFVTLEKCILFTDSRYITQAEETAAGCGVVMVGGASPFKSLADEIKKESIRRVAFESEHVTHETWKRLKDALKFPIRGVTRWVEELRKIKSDGEIALIRKAVRLAEAGFNNILPMIKPGVQERDLAVELEFFFKRNGAREKSFDIIVASGPRSAMPHAEAGNRRIKAGDPLVVDFGCEVDGYHSDITRTLFVGRPSREMVLIYGIVLKAQKSAMDKIEQGAKCSEIDAEARRIINESGYGKYFGHALGHGVGLEVHEDPRLWARGEEKLERGMVFTVEPGIYLPSVGGVRIEDMMAMGGNGPERLTRLRRNPTVL